MIAQSPPLLTVEEGKTTGNPCDFATIYGGSRAQKSE